jgi:hypothetical protein
MTSGFEIENDSKGVPTLFVTGAWSAEMEEAFRDGDWRAVALRAPSWESYKPLVPFMARIEWLRVPFGPDSSRGLDELLNLRKLQVTDALSPPVDYRRLPRLQWLETLWSKRSAEYLNHPSLEVLIVHGVGSPGLDWLSDAKSIRTLEIRNGGLRSLRGIEACSLLTVFRASDLKKCFDVDSIMLLEDLHELQIDAPAAKMGCLDWLDRNVHLSELLLSVRVEHVDWHLIASHPSLASISLTSPDVDRISDHDLVREFEKCGKRVTGVQRFPSEIPGIQLQVVRL